MVKCLPELTIFIVFLKNRKLISIIRRSKVTYYAVIVHAFLSSDCFFQNRLEKFFQEYLLSDKQVGARSGPTFCRA